MTPLQNVEPIITPKEARKLLGASFKDISDEETTSLVHRLSCLASALVDWAFRSTNSTQNAISGV